MEGFNDDMGVNTTFNYMVNHIACPISTPSPNGIHVEIAIADSGLISAPNYSVTQVVYVIILELGECQANNTKGDFVVDVENANNSVVDGDPLDHSD